MAHETTQPARLAKKIAFEDMSQCGINPSSIEYNETLLNIKFSMVMFRMDNIKCRNGIFVTD